MSTSVLDRIVGQRKAFNDGEYTKWAFVSAGKESTSHPRKMVTNAFLRRGARPYATKGAKLHYGRQMPSRGWGQATSIDFSPTVEP